MRYKTSAKLPVLSVHPVRDAVAATALLIGVSFLCSFVTYIYTADVYRVQMREQLVRLAEGAASFVDGDEHEKFVSVEQEKTEEYRRAIEPLRSLLGSVGGVRYIYTTRMTDGEVRFVLDSAPYGDHDGDGVEDHSPIMQLYEDPDPEMLRAYQEGKPTASPQPYRDQWGVFVSGYAPIFSSDARLVGVLGVDMKAEDFEARMGLLRWAFLTGLALSGLASALIGFLVFVFRRHAARMIEERRTLEAQLLQAQKMESVGHLAGGIAHDLNNQLTPLCGYLEMALSEMPPDSKLYQYLQEMGHAARRCTEVVRQLLNFSRPSSKKKEVLELDNLVRNFKKSFVNFLPSTIQTKVLLEDGLRRVRGNATELESVLLNLVTNARDAMPEGGVLTIEVRNAESGAGDSFGAAGAFTVLSVKDTGTGIPEEIRAKIFDPFFSTKKRGLGAGLGLTMVYRIIQEHGGWVEVLSKPGAGSDFRVYLPVCPDSLPQEPAAAAVVSGAPMLGKNEEILFADDEPQLRDLGKMMLERLGYRPVLAADGEEASQIYESGRGRFAAVVLDMTMPRMTGRQAMKRILQANPKARILLVSGFTLEGTESELIREGAKAFLPKPYEVSVFSRTLRRIIDGTD